jgi:hypothetical protein
MKNGNDLLESEKQMEKETGYDAWLTAKVRASKTAMQSGKIAHSSHANTMDRAWRKLLANHQMPAIPS